MPSNPPEGSAPKGANLLVDEPGRTSEAAITPPGPRRIRSIEEVFGPHGRRFVLIVAIVTLVFLSAWIGVARGAIADALYSYVVLIPFISLWLIWQRPSPAVGSREGHPWLGFVLLAAAAACAIGGVMARRSGWLGSSTLLVGDVKDPSSLASKLRSPPNAISAYVRGLLGASTVAQLDARQNTAEPPRDLQASIIEELNEIIKKGSVWDETRFTGARIRSETRVLIESAPTGERVARLNRLLLEDAYPLELSRNPGTSWLTTQMAAWVIAIWGAAMLCLGWNWVRNNLFACCFLAFTIPLPDPLVNAIELALQSASATASDWLFAMSGTPYLRDGMAFWLPNIRIQVAPECSGIRSTLVLLITGTLGAHLLLRQLAHRLAVVSVIVPLGILRNAIRILTLTLLSVHVDPEIMNSALHKRGGPLFFAVSLIPLFLMFWWFGRRERKSLGRR